MAKKLRGGLHTGAEIISCVLTELGSVMFPESYRPMEENGNDNDDVMSTGVCKLEEEGKV